MCCVEEDYSQQDQVKVFSHEGDGENTEHLNSMDLHDIKTELERDAEKAEVCVYVCVYERERERDNCPVCLCRPQSQHQILGHLQPSQQKAPIQLVNLTLSHAQ